MIDAIFSDEFWAQQLMRLPARLQQCVLNRVTRFREGNDPRTAGLVPTHLLADPPTSTRQELSGTEIRVIFARCHADVVALYFRCTAQKSVVFIFLHVTTSHGVEPGN